MKATVGERGQVTIPKVFRDDMGLMPGMEIEFTLERGRLIGTKSLAKDPVEAVTGCLGKSMDTDRFINELRGDA